MSESDLTELADFREILSSRFEDEYPLLVGGHAVNLWASFYSASIGSRLAKWLPLTSKDLDLFGTVSLLEALKDRFGGSFRLSGPRSPVVGQLVTNLGGPELKVDVLRDVYGLRKSQLLAEAIVIEIEMAGHHFHCRVLPVIVLLEAKIANLANLDQSGRNDLKHVHLMLLVAEQFLSALVEAVDLEGADSRSVVNQLELARKVTATPEAQRCAKAYNLDFSTIWPRELLEQSQDSRLQNFVKHRLPR